MRRELAQRDKWRKEDRKEDTEKMEKLADRCAILEKLLKFSNLQKQEMNMDELEGKMRSMIEFSFNPT